MSRSDQKSAISARQGTAVWEIRIALTIAVIAFLLNIIFLVQREIPKSENPEVDSFTLSGGPEISARARSFVTCSLGVIVVGLAMRKSLGIATGLAGAPLVIFVYGWWYRRSLQSLRNYEVLNYSDFDSDLPHAGGLWGATWWDITVLAIPVLLLIGTSRFCSEL